MKVEIFILLLFVLYNIIIICTYSQCKLKIIWDKNNIIPPLFVENITLDYYIYKNIKFYMYIRNNDFISNTIKFQHSWSDCNSIYNIWNEYHLWKYPIMLDVGANIGTCSLLMLYAHVKVISFEPLQNNIHIITKSVLYNKKYVDNFTLYMIGLSNRTSNKTIYINPTNWGGSSIIRHTNYKSNVQIYKLDDLNIRFNEKIGLMKIDIECSELHMIQGASKFIDNNYIKIIFFEELCLCYKYYNSTSNNIYNILEDKGYRIANKIDCKKEKYKDIIAIRD